MVYAAAQSVRRQELVLELKYRATIVVKDLNLVDLDLDAPLSCLGRR